MNRRQRKHSKWVRDSFAKEQKEKYEIGSAEHPNSELEDMPVLEELQEAKNEFIDGYTYVLDSVKKVEELIWENRRLRARLSYLEQELEANI